MPGSPVAVLSGSLARLRARWLWQPDKWERLGVVARLAAPARGASVADVGGRGHELRGLLPRCRVTSINLEPPCDVVYSGDRLPFDDHAFEVVTSSDVLEHIPSTHRSDHIRELVRIAASRVVICFPCGSDTKDASERRLAVELERDHGVSFDFLDEHLEHGLPRVGDVLESIRLAAPGAAVRVGFQDGVMEAEQLLLDAVRAVKGRQLAALLRSARSWLVRRWPVLTDRESEDNNRAYLVIDLER